MGRFKKNNFIYLFISVCAGSSLLLRLLSSCGVRASHCHDVSCRRAQALDHWLSSQWARIPSSNNTREDSIHGHHQMVNTEIRLMIFFAAKDGEALYSQQKQDQELTVAQIMNSLLPNSDLN